MGRYELISQTKAANMKFLALLLLATLAYAEEEAAKPTVLYAAHYPYYGYAGLHYPYALTHHALVKPYTYYANSGGAIHIVKRDAEASPDADAEASPESLYAGYYGAYPTTYHYGLAGWWILWTWRILRIRIRRILLGLNVGLIW